MGILRVLGAIALPEACASCRVWEASPLCAACLGALPRMAGPVCERCGAPGSACARCRASRPAFDRARAAVRYQGVARDVLIAFKLRGERRAAAFMAAEMSRVRVVAPHDAICFVPATRRSAAVRGFVPAQVLARRLAPALGVPLAPLLRKRRETRDQAGLGREDRLRNLEDAFGARGRVPQRVLLVDDVMTTGATAHACATALRAAGARWIEVTTFARAVD